MRQGLEHSELPAGPRFFMMEWMQKAAVILKEKNWCQGALALDSDGQPTEDYRNAASCCLIGSLLAVFPDALIREESNRKLSLWNDSPDRTKDQVVRFLEVGCDGLGMAMIDGVPTLVGERTNYVLTGE